METQTRRTYMYLARTTDEGTPSPTSSGQTKSQAKTHACIRRSRGESIVVWRTERRPGERVWEVAKGL